MSTLECNSFSVRHADQAKWVEVFLVFICQLYILSTFESAIVFLHGHCLTKINIPSKDEHINDQNVANVDGVAVEPFCKIIKSNKNL